jgi:hypothetical protein
MKGPAVTLTNGRYEFRVRSGRRFVLADPPEAGWRIEAPAARRAEMRATPRIASGRERDRRPGCEMAKAEEEVRR